MLGTGAKVGVNYLKYFGDRLTKSETESRLRLDESNAEDIYNGLKSLKGSALKVAQMLSMDKNILPKAYSDKFSLSQFSVPPLSPALVMKTFRDYFQKSPSELFDEFDAKSIYAASIGQVHKAKLKGKDLAVKIQYPGVAASISSDLALVKPVALKMFNVKGAGLDVYFNEVKDKLLEETDYRLELQSSVEIATSCSEIENLQFPQFYPELSTDRILTMDWMSGIHLSEFSISNKDPELSNKIGQTLWDFYMFQIHTLKKVHADPHPGNFLVSPNNELIVLDFGCVKSIPLDFYNPYFELAKSEIMQDEAKFATKLEELGIVKDGDEKGEREFITQTFHQLLTLFTKPLHTEVFDFSDSSYFTELTTVGEELSKNSQFRNMDGSRGSKHFIYVNRTFFGLYNLLYQIGANRIQINTFIPKVF
jgi:predicted unusual protein kinase regulating ubiquinone biosynthesis (AarF/ABC1/UbiB family)